MIICLIRVICVPCLYFDTPPFVLPSSALLRDVAAARAYPYLRPCLPARAPVLTRSSAYVLRNRGLQIADFPLPALAYRGIMCYFAYEMKLNVLTRYAEDSCISFGPPGVPPVTACDGWQ